MLAILAVAPSFPGAMGCTAVVELDGLGVAVAATSGTGGQAGMGAGGAAAGGSGGDGGAAFSLGGALELTSSCLSAADSESDALDFGADAFTVELWFVVDELHAGFLVWKGGMSPSQPGWGADVTVSGDVVLNVCDGTGVGQARATGLTPGHLYHVAFVRDGMSLRVWLFDKTAQNTNHVLGGSTTPQVAPWTTPYRFAVGGSADSSSSCGTNYKLRGTVDELVIWRVARDGPSLDAALGRHPDCTDPELAAYYAFDGTGNAAQGCGTTAPVLYANQGTEGIDYAWIDSPFD